MSIVLADAGHHKHLLPLTFTRPVGALRPGILTLADTWWRMTELPVSYRTEAYLQGKFPLNNNGAHWEVDASVLPQPDLVSAVLDLEPGEVLMHTSGPVAFRLPTTGDVEAAQWIRPEPFWKRKEFVGDVLRLDRPWKLFQHCKAAIINDFALLTEGRRSARLSNFNTIIGDPDLIFLEEGAVVEASILNTMGGPIYIGKGAEVMEGCMLRGPIALGDHAQIKMGAKIYGPSAFGPECRVGGEVNNSVMLGYSNKGHDGFLGNSVLGEWCNLGADTNNSNLKNTYGEVKVWSYADEAMVPTGLQFCGLIMGDHSKSGINTMFNTGTVVGICANVFGGGFPPKYIPSFAWGGADGFTSYDTSSAFATARRVMERRHVPFTGEDERILLHVQQVAGEKV